MRRIAGPLLVAVIALGALATGLWTARALLPPAKITLESGTLLPQPRPLAPFSLTDTEGEPFTAEALRGHWTVLAFGYASCPDVCPTVLAGLRDVRRRLMQAARGGTVHFVFISVDPERDTLSMLREYVRYFDASFRAATGPHTALHQLTGQLGVVYRRGEQDSALGYVVDHTATLLVVDPQGRLAALFSAPHEPAALARDIAALTGPLAR